MKYIFLILLVITYTILNGQSTKQLTPADKIYGLSKFWQEVNYNFVYLDKIDRAKWDSTYRQLINKVQYTKSDYDYYRELQKFCALLKDGHTNVYLPKHLEQMNTMFGAYRLYLKNIDDKAIIVRTNLSKKNEVPVGSEIIEVNGMTTRDYIAQHVAPYISSSTEYVRDDWAVDRLLEGREGDQYIVKLRTPQGKIVTLNLVHAKTTEEAVYPEVEKMELLTLKWFDNQRIAYVALNYFGEPLIDTLFTNLLPQLYKAKGLILDLRMNGGGNTDIGTSILQYLTNDTLLFGAKSVSRLHIPTFKAWGKFTKASDTVANEWSKKSYLSFHDRYYYQFDYRPDTVKLDAKRLIVPTVLLLGHQTASAAEDFLIYADNQKHMTTMGERSFGSTGQPLMFELPGGGMARVCTKKDMYPDGREFVGYGIKPDIEIKPSVNDFIQDKDPVLDKAVEYLVKKALARTN